MKEFIYLDTAFLHSFIAQLNEGLPLSSSTEFQESESKMHVEGKTNQSQNELGTEFATGQIRLPGILESPSAKGNYKFSNTRGTNNSSTLTQLEAGKEIISKQLHDDALHQFESYIATENLIKKVDATTTINPGDYVLYKGKFEIFDINYLIDSLNVEKLSVLFDFMVRDRLITDQAAAATSGGQQKHTNKQMQDESRKKLDEMKRQLNIVSTSLEYVSLVLPQSSYLRIDSFICPLKSEFLREKSKELIFKYGKDSVLEVSVLGKHTKVFDSLVDKVNDSSNSLVKGMNEISSMADGLFEQLGIIKKGDFIVSPVAIYFE